MDTDKSGTEIRQRSVGGRGNRVITGTTSDPGISTTVQGEAGLVESLNAATEMSYI